MSASAREREGALEAVDRIIGSGGDADDILREVVAVLAGLYPYVALGFTENGEIVVGPALGDSDWAPFERFPISYQGVVVGELVAASSDDDRPFLEGVASRLSAHVLLGWDTDGERWDA